VVEIRKDVEGSGTPSDGLSGSIRGDLHVKVTCFLYISPCLKLGPDSVILGATCSGFIGKTDPGSQTTQEMPTCSDR
jgi:hypothetical protein